MFIFSFLLMEMQMSLFLLCFVFLLKQSMQEGAYRENPEPIFKSWQTHALPKK